MAGLILENINKIYPNGVKALKNINLEIEDGEFIVILGPSGCGKSTMLRVISGLEDITSGDLYLDGIKANDFSPKKRNISMVFQNYALYPHLNVYENIEFFLKMNNENKEERRKKVSEVMKEMDITHIEKRKPKEISGGQRQRVALGRALVKNPEIFLFDEPLSNLDYKLRNKMKITIIELHKNLKNSNKNSTMIYVTHDQLEAMTMADKICVMNEGEIVQFGTPMDIYMNPKNKFIADFVGTPSMNFFKSKVFEEDRKLYVSLGENKLEISKELSSYLEKEIILGIRAEDIKPSIKKTDPKNKIYSKIEIVENMGSEAFLHFKVENYSFVSRESSQMLKEIGTKKEINFIFDNSKLFYFDSESEKNILYRDLEIEI